MSRAPIHVELERGAVAALSAGDHRRAFQLADRRCRTRPAASAQCFVLRAEALKGLGHPADALADLARALDVDPTDVSANRRLLSWGSGPARLEAASALVTYDHDFESLRRCLEVLRDAGRANVASVTVLDGRIAGWAAWAGDAPIEVVIDSNGDAQRTRVLADPFHPLAGPGMAAASFEIARPRSPTPQRIEILLAGELLRAETAAPNAARPAARRGAPPEDAPPKDAPTRAATVIVPVYADPEATGACLDSLLAQLPSAAIDRVILVDDAAPDPRIKALMTEAARHPSVLVIENAKNLGFVGSVNRALALTTTSDVILLNADTVVPPGFAQRLADAAHSAPDIGTVTPLSNNGEYTSFPVFYRSVPLPDAALLQRLDQAAATANRGVVIDMPNGIGFCLYIRRDCLDAVGPLAEVYHRGYFEDVDICLLARERGYRNVCAASVFVGHAGSRSFGPDKRALVLRNRKVLDQRFPEHEREVTAFQAADPLRRARAAIERIVPPTARNARLIVTDAGPGEVVARERAGRLAAAGEAVLIARIERGALGCDLAICGTGEDMPQSLRFALAEASERRALKAWLDLAAPTRIEWAAPASVGPALVDLLAADGRPCDILIADAGLVAPRGMRYSPAMLARDPTHESPDAAAHRARWQRIAAGAEAILLPSAAAEAFAARALPKAIKARRVRLDAAAQPQPAPNRNDGARLGLLALGATLADRARLRGLAAHLSAGTPGVVVLGNVPEADIAAWPPGIAMTGRLAPAQVPTLIERYDIGAVAAVSAAPVFGHPIEIAALAAGCRHAAFDWSGAAAKNRTARNHLALDPDADLATIATRLMQWWLS